VDESKDMPNKVQMTIVLRFVNKEGYEFEHFANLVHVKDTSSLTLKNKICYVLSRCNLNVKDIQVRGMIELAIYVENGL